MRAKEAWMSAGYDARYHNTDEVLKEFISARNVYL